MNAYTPFYPAMTVSREMELHIPREVVESLRLKPGQEVRAMPIDGVIQLVPVMSLEEACGFLGPMDTTVEREPDRDF